LTKPQTVQLNKSIHQQLVCGKGGVNRTLMTRTSADHRG
jgi:hypothetical protein